VITVRRDGDLAVADVRILDQQLGDPLVPE
jgi:hypothetical protein